MSILARPEGRETAECLDPDLKHALAAILLQQPGRRSPCSDTALKFRHEVTETLRVADRAYDLDLRLAPGFNADLAILPMRSGARASRGTIWLLDGPEAFHRPFSASADGNAESIGEPLLQLVPAERRRAELLAALRDRDNAQAMATTLAAWSPWAWAHAELPHFGLTRTAAGSNEGTGKLRLARMHWLEWAAMEPRARLLALSDPEARPAVQEDV